MLSSLSPVIHWQDLGLHDLQTPREGQGGQAVSDFNSDLVIDLFKQRDELRAENDALKQRIERLEKAEQWIPASTKPEGCERKVLLWIVWPNVREWCDSPEPLIGWWKHGPQCFALGDIENADHLVRYWMEIPDPTEAKEAKP